MIDGFGLDIKGLDDVDKALTKLGSEIGEKVMVGALRDAAKPIEEAMLAKVPVGKFPVLVSNEKNLNRRLKGSDKRVWIAPGELKKRVKIKSSKAIKKKGLRKGAKKDEVAQVRVGIHRAYYAQFVEFGTKYQSARPFIRPAINAKSAESIQIYKARIRHRIKLAEKRLARQAKAGQNKR